MERRRTQIYVEEVVLSTERPPALHFMHLANALIAFRPSTVHQRLQVYAGQESFFIVQSSCHVYKVRQASLLKRHYTMITLRDSSGSRALCGVCDLVEGGCHSHVPVRDLFVPPSLCHRIDLTDSVGVYVVQLFELCVVVHSAADILEGGGHIECMHGERVWLM